MPAIVSVSPKRLVSLDAFRGATIASMILVNNAGNGATTFAPLLHSRWHGWTFTDLVFPFFLWMVGVAMTLSYARRVEEGADKGKLLLHTFRRAALIFLLGLFLNGFPLFDLSHLRIPGVLQRIAVCYFIGALIFLYTKWKGQVVAIVAVCTVYWMLMTLYPVPGYGPGVLEPIGNFSQYIDSLLIPTEHLYRSTKVWDPEGIVSTLPAIATVLFGVLLGHLLRLTLTLAEKTSWMLVGGILLTAVGSILELAMPINKQLWTVSYTVFVAGLAQMTFGCFYWFIDVLGYQKWAKPLVIYGMNAIAVYAMSGILARLLGITGVRGPLYQTIFVPLGPPKIASLLYALANVLVLYLLAYVMYRKKWFVRL